MPFVTTLTLRSGDRAALDGVVDDIRQQAERKGIELKGPHTSPPDTYRVRQYRRPSNGEGRFPDWEYTVYERRLRLSGHDDSVRRIAGWPFPRSVHVEVSVDQVRSAGRD